MPDFSIRPYVPADRPVLLSLLALNIPTFFALTEADDFACYLDSEREDYAVACEAERIIGCGGINYFPEERCARISWDVFHPDAQGKGYGTRLLQHRLHRLAANPRIQVVKVRTSQISYGFYEKNGFRTLRTVPDFWAPGYDLVEMEWNQRT